ncbi:EmrB/QacA subfamily drug resistance transporter [Herbihabitans rhizosphaerae]|uniref:EmrB/QacA subfamily drug resistance transporter n=1 Tax=Herbihabitans rhizosphaerae TaxID=1872711 RepID=A0A4Q7KXS5_9PSEU|nr:MFS transporter [Herbihabitans rhizosphaerae]RZS41140.1 EmrB/QacA subfamily drug resistance transporter [Herbihabitans rhizosphaerae]
MSTPAAEEVRWGSPVARGVLVTTILGSGMAMLDGTIINVALPRIGAELGADIAGLQWILDGYLLALAALILVAGSFGDRYGRRKVFTIGVLWFGAASALCGLAQSTEMLVAARVLQGIGGALLTPGSLAIIQASFARKDRARAIGAWSGLSGIAAAVGPLVGGLLVQLWSWRLAFLINVPLAVLCVWMARKYVPESCDAQMNGKPDVVGAVVSAVGLAGVTAALIEAPVRGVGDPLVIGAAVIGLAALAGFVVTQVKVRDPLVPPDLFANRTFVASNLLTLVVYAALGGVMMLMVLQLQTSLGYSPTESGVAGLPITVIMLVLSARSGKLAQRIGPRVQLVLGPMLIAAGMLLLLRVEPGASYIGAVLPGVVVFGLGLSTVVAPVTATVLAASADRHAGAASGVNNAIARTGSLLAVAVLPAVAGLTGASYADPTALTEGWRTALWVCAGLCVLGGVAALAVDNGVLRAEPDTTPDLELGPTVEELARDESPHPGECMHCGVEGPPTHVVPVRKSDRLAG